MLAHLRISSSDFARSWPEVSLKSARSWAEVSLKLAQSQPKVGPKFAQMENSTTITKSDWLFAHHPIPNAKFQPITL